MTRRGPAILAVVLLLGIPDGAPADPPAAVVIPDLPRPITNNAVAVVQSHKDTVVVSLMGLGAGKAWRDTSSAVFRYRLGADRWEALPDVPGPGGRLAATAVELGGQVLVFGGYTVAPDGAEVSVPLVHRLDPETGRYVVLAPMPVAVDDAVSFVHDDRYVYLVSGWHDDDNVDQVQVYDSDRDRWFQATPFPGEPVFGHAGGAVDGKAVICDGVGVRQGPGAGRSFRAVAACYLGLVDRHDPTRIDWRRLPHHGGPASYRMAAVGSRRLNAVVFAGGSDNPYNYDGQGYDGRPSHPSDRIFGFDLENDRWVELGRLPAPGMDHRGLIEIGDRMGVVGGMREGRSVSAGVLLARIPRGQHRARDPGRARADGEDRGGR